MNWERICNWEIKEKNKKLYVTLSVNHIRGTRNFTRETYDTSFILNYLKDNKIDHGEILEPSIVYNFHSYEKCKGTWIFSCNKKTNKIIEKKQNVTKITNKKTTKK